MNTQATSPQPGADTRAIRTHHDCRTYRDLLQINPASYNGNCCACHKWGRDVWKLSTRAFICRECIERKGDAVLGSILKSERAARRWIKNHPNTRSEAKWVSHITGASLAFVEAEIARVSSSDAGSNR